jgi:hypothetical protein
LDLAICSGRPRAYLWALALAPALCSDLAESRSTGGVDCAIANPVPPMLLASSRPHGCFSTNVLGVRIEVWPMELPCRRSVRTDPTVDGGVVVRLGRVLRALVDVGCRLPLVGQSPCLQLGYRLPRVCCRLRKNNKMIRGYAHMTIRINQ